MRKRLVAISLLACSMCCATALRAEDAPPPAKPADSGKPAGDPKKDAETTRIDKAKALVKELEDAVLRAKAAQPVDAQLLQKLLAALDAAKALTVPAKPSELTPEEKKAVIDEAKKQAGDPQSEAADRALAKAFEGADLTEEESIKAKQIIGDWYKDATASMGDSKKQSELKRKRDDDLDKSLGKKKAQKVINNLNAMGPRR